MKIVFSTARKVQQFATIFANLKNFTENVCIYFRPDEVYIQCMDDSHCSLFECKLNSAWFQEYEYNEDQTSIGINIGMVNKVLNTWNESQTVSIELAGASSDSTGEAADKILFKFENGENITGQFNKYFELPLVNIESELMDVKLFDTLVDLTVDSKVFGALINQLSIFDSNLTLIFNEDNVECISSGTGGSMKALIKVEDVKEYATSEGILLKQSYSLRYVHQMCQFNKLAAEIQMGFSENTPMIMKYDLSDAAEETSSYARIHLAPKMIEDF
jgi:proliferating cell nuclear antigen PCNA